MQSLPKTVSRDEVHHWCKVNEEGLWYRPLPKAKPKEKPSDIPPYICQSVTYKRDPWYLREPKQQWKWLFSVLRFVRERWIGLATALVLLFVIVATYWLTAM